MIKELTTFISTKTALVIGTTLFAGFIPSEVSEDAVAVIESGGVPDFDLTDKEAKTIQVLSLSRNYWTARSNALLVHGVLHGMKGETLSKIDGGPYFVNTGEALSVPQSLGQDEKGRFAFSTNYVLRIENY
jgi:hypothetical protein